MAVNKTVCPGCGVTMVECRRYRLEPLAEFMRMTMSATCIEVNVSGSTQKGALCHGVTRRIVDRIAEQLKEHPATIWPEVVDHDIEDTSRVCVECGERFMGRRSDAKYCSERCRGRVAARRHAAKKRAEDPEWRARKLAYQARHYEECKTYRLKWQAAYYRRNRESRLAYMERYRAERRDEAS